MFAIQYQAINRRGEIETRQKDFTTERARDKWIDRQEALAEEERSGFLGVTAWEVQPMEQKH